MNNEILINPFTAINVFADARSSMGTAIFTDQKYQKIRHAWAISMFLLGLRAYDKHEWWFSPEFAAYTFDKSADNIYTVNQTRSVVVSEWTDADPEIDLISALQKTVQDSLLDSKTTVVCFVRRSTPLPPFSELAKQLLLVNLKVRDIWIVTSLTQDETNWMIGSVYPEPNGVTVDYEKIVNESVPIAFLTPYKGDSVKNSYEPAMTVSTLTPEFTFE